MTTTINQRSVSSIKRRWVALQGREFSLDYSRAKLLHDVFRRLDRDEDHLTHFISGVLEEHGRRVQRFVRMTLAFDKVSDIGIWSKVGASAMILFAALTKRQRNKVEAKVEAALEKTGRQNISIGAFRNIVKRVIGERRYQEKLVEPRTNTRAQLNALRGFILAALRSNPNLLSDMPDDVKEVLGIDLVE